MLEHTCISLIEVLQKFLISDFNTATKVVRFAWNSASAGAKAAAAPGEAMHWHQNGFRF